MKKVIWIVSIWLVVINLFALAGVNRLNLTGDTALNDRAPSEYTQEKTWSVFSLHPHWDEHWYVSVARDGYFVDHHTYHSNTAFFPLYPVSIKLLTFISGSYVVSGLLLSIAFLFGACIFLYNLVKEFHPEAASVRTVMLLLFFPTAFFLSSVYAESSFLFFSVATFYFLFKRKFWIAGLFGLLASLTRITGLFLLLPFLVELFVAYNGKIWRKESLSVLLIPAGTLMYFTYLAIHFGNFFQFFAAQAEWGRNFSLNVSHLSFQGTNAISTSLDILFVIFAIVISIYILKKMRTSYGVYMLAILLAAIASGTFISMGRIVLALFPLYIFAASLKSETTRFAWLLPSTLLLGLYTLLFVNGYWAG